MPEKLPENASDDELERVAQQGDLDELNAYLKTHRVLIPMRPRRFLDPKELTREQLLEEIKKDSEELKKMPFEPWILEVNGKKRLPVFSSTRRMEEFSRHIAQDLKQAFSLRGAKVPLELVARHFDIDFVDLNPFSENSREIGLRRRGGWLSSLRRIAGLGS